MARKLKRTTRRRRSSHKKRRTYKARGGASNAGATHPLKYIPPSGPSPIRVIISSDKWMPSLTMLLQSCKDNGYEYEVVGMDVPWENFITRIKNYVKGAETSVKERGPDALILFMDAFDTLVVKNVEKTLAAFNARKRSNLPILVAAESFCYSNCSKESLAWYDAHSEIYGDRKKVEATLIKQRKDHARSDKPVFPNGGIYMGKGQAMLDTLNTMLSYGISDDQLALGKYVGENPDKIDLDLEGVIFRNKFDSFDAVQEKKPDECTDAGPSFLHWPGTADKSKLNEYLKNYCGKNGQKGGSSFTPTFHILIATAGRPHLKHLLASLTYELSENDAVTIVFDGKGKKQASGWSDDWIADFKAPVSVIEEQEKKGHWGHPIRTAYQGKLSPQTTFIMHADDDDEYIIGFAHGLREACTDPQKLYIARFFRKSSPRIILPSKFDEIRLGDIGTPSGIIPWADAAKAEWLNEKGGDGKYYLKLASIIGKDRVQFLSNIIYFLSNK